MSLEWSFTCEGVDWEELAAVYRAAPLGNKHAEGLCTAYGHSLFMCFVRDGGRLVGAGRVLADGVDCAYLCDIALLPSHQGQGLGAQIVERLLALARGHRKIILYAVPGKEDFYRRFGFQRMSTAMAIFADPDAALAAGYLRED